jgi:hypothetical protein
MIKRINEMMPMIIEMTNILYFSELIGNEKEEILFNICDEILPSFFFDIQHHCKCLDEI